MSNFRIVKRDPKTLEPTVLYLKRRYKPVRNGTASSFTPGMEVEVWPGSPVNGFDSIRIYGQGKSEQWVTDQAKIAKVQRPLLAPIAPGGESRTTFQKTYGAHNVVITMGEKHAAQGHPKPLLITMGNGVNLDWSEWEDLVETVNKTRDELPLQAIAAKLAAEVAIEDELQAYIKEKGLA